MKWSKEAVHNIISERNAGKSWGSIGKEYHTDGENVRAAFRRFVGAKESAYKNSRPLEMRTSYNNPRVAVLDIETLPMICYTWGLFDQNISVDQVITSSCLLGWAGKMLNGSEMHSDIMTPEEAKKRDTTRVTQSAYDFLSKVDIVIGHNYYGFDEKILNTHFLEHGLPPLKHIIVDTFLVAKRNFRFDSNKLKYINGRLGIRNKLETDFELWRGCDLGDQESLTYMQRYNEVDIYSTEELFYKVRPYVRNMNVALYNEMTNQQCPVCGSIDLVVEGEYHTPAGVWESVRCKSCGCLSRDKYNQLDKDKRKSLMVNS